MTEMSEHQRFEIDWLEDRSDEGLLAELRRVANLTPDRPLTRDRFEREARISSSAIERRFGSWNEAKRRAGLPDAPPDYSDESILADLVRVSASNPHTSFSYAFYSKHGGRYSTSLVTRRFGGWSEALGAAGIGSRYSGPTVSDRMRQEPARYVTNEELIHEIRALAARLGKKMLNGVEIAAHLGWGPDLIRRRFGGLAGALRRAGVQQGKIGRRHSEDEAFRNLFEVWVHYGRAPTHSEMDRPPSIVGSHTYIKRYGGWRKALRAFIARANSEAGSQVRPRPSAASEPQRTEGELRSEPVPARIPKRTAGVRALGTRALPQTTPRPSDVRQPTIGLRFKVFRRDRFRCSMCGRSTANDPSCVLHVDHIVPFSKGGKTTLENLQLLCAECNVGKSNRAA